MKKKSVIILIIVAVIFISLIIFSIYYLNDYYKADDIVNDYLKSGDAVKVSNNNGTYFFDGYGEDNAIIFYPGGKVENKAYAPLLYNLAKNGIDCFLIDMPFKLAIFNVNAADSIVDNYTYKNWYMMGHSLGGVAVSMYTEKSKDIKGIIMLAAYPNNKIKDDIRLLSIYGSQDGVLNLKKYNDSKNNWNKESYEIIIEGGNHSNFGYYGFQKGDKEPKVTREEQQKRTLNEIIKFVKL